MTTPSKKNYIDTGILSRSRGLRVIPIDNYLVFYLPDETKKTVAIIRIMYGSRDIAKHLSAAEE